MRKKTTKVTANAALKFQQCTFKRSKRHKKKSVGTCQKSVCFKGRISFKFSVAWFIIPYAISCGGYNVFGPSVSPSVLLWAFPLSAQRWTRLTKYREILLLRSKVKDIHGYAHRSIVWENITMSHEISDRDKAAIICKLLNLYAKN